MGSYPSHFEHATAFASNGAPMYSRRHGQWVPYHGSHHQHRSSSWFNNPAYPSHQHRHYPGNFSASSPALSNSYALTHSPFYGNQQYMYNNYPASYYNNSHGQPLYYSFR